MNQFPWVSCTGPCAWRILQCSLFFKHRERPPNFFSFIFKYRWSLISMTIVVTIPKIKEPFKGRLHTHTTLPSRHRLRRTLKFWFGSFPLPWFSQLGKFPFVGGGVIIIRVGFELDGGNKWFVFWPIWVWESFFLSAGRLADACWSVRVACTSVDIITKVAWLCRVNLRTKDCCFCSVFMISTQELYLSLLWSSDLVLLIMLRSDVWYFQLSLRTPLETKDKMLMPICFSLRFESCMIRMNVDSYP